MAFRLSTLFGLSARRHARSPVWRSALGDAVLTLTGNGEIRAASPGAETMIGAGGGLVRRSLLEFAARDDRMALRDALARAGDAPKGAAAERIALRLLRPGRAPALAEITLARRGSGLAALMRDCAAELAALRTARAAEETADDAGGDMADGGGLPADMLADLGHELKTPLNAIMGFAEAMARESFGPIGHDKYREYAGLIHSSGAHLADLIAAILDRAKIDAGRYRLTPALAAPGPLAAACAEMVRGEAEKAGLALKVDIAPELSETMLDARAVRQILINLLSNAVKFTAAGEIGLHVSERDGVLSFDVSDTGVGMSQMALARLGERFTDIHKSGVRGAAGTGLGLSLAFSLAKLHGGALTFSSAPGEGTIARLDLPVRKTLAEMSEAGLSGAADIQSQLDRVAQYRRERGARNAA
jgi:signal transduction histidine kinase